MTVSVWQADDTQPVRAADLVIIGAGLVGCAAAYFAAQAGRQVTIIDARDAGLGTSSRNAGFMLTGLDSYYHRATERYGLAAVRELWGISAATHRFWRRIIQADGGVRLAESGSLLLAESAAERDDLRLAARAMQADGIDVIYHDRDPLGRGYHAAIEQPWDAAVQPYELVQAVLRASGATLVPNTECYRLAADGAGVMVYTRQLRFRARQVLICANASAAYLDPYLAGLVFPTRAQCLVTEPLPQGAILHTCGYSDYGAMYYRDTFDGRLLIGGGRKQNVALEHDTTDDRVTAPVQAVLDAYLRARFPDVTAPVARRWAGIMAFTPDGLPVVGTLPDLPQVGFCIACNGHGLALGAACAERAVDLLVSGARPGAIDARRLAG